MKFLDADQYLDYLENIKFLKDVQSFSLTKISRMTGLSHQMVKSMLNEDPTHERRLKRLREKENSKNKI